MQNRNRTTSIGRAAVSGIVVAAAWLNGCARMPGLSTACDGPNFDKVTLVPGCSASCGAEPCQVYFTMPEGRETFVVRAPNYEVGEYPGGETVFLGSFWGGTHVLMVEGTDLPPAYLRVPSSSGGGGPP